MERYSSILLWCFLLLPAATAGAQQPFMEINGRVIDANSQPVKDARVIFYDPRCNGCTEMLVITDTTEANGRFHYREASHNKPYMRVFAEEKVPENAWNPINSLFMDSAKIPGLQTTVVSKNGLSNLGDIPLTVRYQTTQLDLADVFKRKLPAGAFGSLKLQVTLGKKVVARDLEIPPQFMKGSTLGLALPLPLPNKGMWKLTFSFEDNKTKYEDFVFVGMGTGSISFAGSIHY
jgi:hypothetical protein